MLVSMKEILDKANEGNYAVPAAVAQTELNARAAIKTAEANNSPIIILIPLDILDINVDLFGRYLAQVANDSPVPVAICHDHGSSFESGVKCVKAGFSAIMVDRSSLPYEENVAQVKELVKVAHACGVTVEAELGHVGMAAAGDFENTEFLTEPEMAAKFIEETGIDCLAVAIGTAHGAYNKGQKPTLHYDRLEAIKKATNNFPLVLHGGSGTGDEGLAKVAKMGINKVNIGCELFASIFEEIEAADTTGNGAYAFGNLVEAGYSKRLGHFMEVLDSKDKAWKVEPKFSKAAVAELTEDTIL